MLTPLITLPLLLATAPPQDADTAHFFSAKDWPGLEAHARARLKANPKDAVAHNLLGIALGNQGKAAEARAAFEAAVAADPRLLQARMNLVMNCAASNDRARARKAFSDLQKEAPAAVPRVADRKVVFDALADPPVPTLEWTGPGKGVAKLPPPPAYPYLAANAKVQGEVVVEVAVDAKGEPSKVTVLGGPPQLAAAAEEYAGAWRFEPKLADGKPVPCRAKLSLVFQLEGSTCKVGAGPDLAAAAGSLQVTRRTPAPF